MSETARKPGPLSGIRVLDVSRFLAGPYAGWILAELGADVIKVEDADRPDEARSVGPYFVGEQSLYFASLNGGKRSLALRLRSDEGREALRRVAATVDVVLDNNKPGVIDKFGLGHEELVKINPTVVTCSLSGFGATGPLRERAGYDYTLQALTGVMSMTGEPDGPPGKAGISYIDHGGGLTIALAVCAGLVGAQRTGEARHVDLGLFDIQVSMLTYLAAWQLNAGFEGERTPSASHPSLVPAQNFASSDGHLSIFVGNDAMWARMVEALDDDLLRDERFVGSGGRQAVRHEVIDRLNEVIATKSTEHWVNLFERHHVPCAPVNTLSQAMAEPQIAARGMVVRAEHPEYGSYRVVRGPIPDASSGEPTAAPLLGEHSAQVLREAGLDADEVKQLIGQGIALDRNIGRVEGGEVDNGPNHSRATQGEH